MSTRPAILFIGPLPPPYSGPEISMKLFLESDLRRRCRIFFLRTNFRKDNVHKGKIDLSGILFTIGFFIKLTGFLAFRRPELVYYPITPTQIGWIGRDAPTLLLCRIFRVGAVVHERGSHFKLNYSQFRPWVKKLVAAAFKGVRAAIVQADYLHDEFSAFLPPERIYTLYQAIDSNEYAPAAETGGNGRNILFVGHLTKAKGYCELLRAMPEIWRQVPDAELFCAGNIRRGERGVFFNQYDGTPLRYEDPEELEQHFLAENPCAKTLYHNLGIVTGDCKKKLFAATDIFVLPSFSEGFSRALLEAMSIGKAIVYTPVGAHAEIMTDGVNGILVRPGDQQALAAAIIDLLEHPEKRQAQGLANRNDVLSRFDIATIAAQLFEIFEISIDGKGTRYEQNLENTALSRR